MHDCHDGLTKCFEFRIMKRTAVNRCEMIGAGLIHSGYRKTILVLNRKFQCTPVTELFRRRADIPDKGVFYMTVFPKRFCKQGTLLYKLFAVLQFNQRASAAGGGIRAGRSPACRTCLENFSGLAAQKPFLFIGDQNICGFTRKGAGNENRLSVQIGDAFPVDSGFDNIEFHVIHLRNARFGSDAKLSSE